MPSTPIQEIKDRLDIVQFLKGYLTLQPSGKNWKANCPFHNEKTPSFMVSPERQSWHCFGCGIGGDAFAFIMKYENLEFGEALRILAEKTGVELRKVSPQEYKQFGLLYDVNDAAKDFFSAALGNSSEAKKYLLERKLSNETIKEFDLGWAPVELDALTTSLVKKGFDPSDLVRAGVTLKTERGRLMDRFRGRIMFPIRNHVGKIVGFTGRVLPSLDTGDMGKYVNSPETAVFSKSKVLYGLHASKAHIREAGTAFLVEGQMDFLMSWQAGIKNVVATSGTALTQDHLCSLGRLSDELVMSFDSDEAGFLALERAIDLAEREDFGVKIALDARFKDPADAAAEDPEYLKETIIHAVPATEFYFRRYLPEGRGDFRDRDYVKRLRTILGKIKLMASSVERASWLKALAEKTALNPSSLEEEMEALEVKVDSQGQATKGADRMSVGRELSRWELLSERYLARTVADNTLSLAMECEPWLAPPYGEVLAAIRDGKKKLENADSDEALHFVLLGATADAAEDAASLKDHLAKEYSKIKRGILVEEVRRAELAGDHEAVSRALENLSHLSNNL